MDEIDFNTTAFSRLPQAEKDAHFAKVRAGERTSAAQRKAAIQAEELPLWDYGAGAFTV